MIDEPISPEDHLLEITGCEVMRDILENDAMLPCRDLVLSQWDPDVTAEDRARRFRAEHWLPEPWNGPLTQARLLVVSINPAGKDGRITASPSDGPDFASAASRPGSPPSARRGDRFARSSWEPAEIIDFFQSRWPQRFTADGAVYLIEKGRREKKQRFLGKIARWASEVTDGPGLDGNVCLIELARCGSRASGPARRAVPTCTEHHLETSLRLSPACVIFAVGAEPRRHFEVQRWEIEERLVAGIPRLVLGLPHPNARERRPPLAGGLGQQHLDDLRQRYRETCAGADRG